MKLEFTLSSLVTRQLMDKYNSQNAKFTVEYIEVVLDDEKGVEFIGPRTLTLEESGNPYRGLWLRFNGEDRVLLVEYLRILKMHKDFSRIQFVCDDDPCYWATYEEYKRD